jgi:hypothetical protein
MRTKTLKTKFPSCFALLEIVATDNGTSALDLFGGLIKSPTSDIEASATALLKLGEEATITACIGEESEAKTFRIEHPQCLLATTWLDLVCLTIF